MTDEEILKRYDEAVASYAAACMDGYASPEVLKEHRENFELFKAGRDSLLERMGRRWISVTERLPVPETEVLVACFNHTDCGVQNYGIVTTALYEDGKMNTENSMWVWYDTDFVYDEENDAYIIPEGWWEYKHFNGDDEFNRAIDWTVTHWMELPQLPERESATNG